MDDWGNFLNLSPETLAYLNSLSTPATAAPVADPSAYVGGIAPGMGILGNVIDMERARQESLVPTQAEIDAFRQQYNLPQYQKTGNWASADDGGGTWGYSGWTDDQVAGLLRSQNIAQTGTGNALFDHYAALRQNPNLTLDQIRKINYATLPEYKAPGILDANFDVGGGFDANNYLQMADLQATFGGARPEYASGNELKQVEGMPGVYSIDLSRFDSPGQGFGGPSGSAESMYFAQNPDGTYRALSINPSNYGTTQDARPTNTVWGNLGPLLTVAGGLMFPGAGAAIGNALGAGSGALGSAIGGGLIGGATSALGGGNFLQGALTGGLGSYAGSLFSDALGGATSATTSDVSNLLGEYAGQGFTPAAGLGYNPSSSISGMFDGALGSIASGASSIPAISTGIGSFTDALNSANPVSSGMLNLTSDQLAGLNTMPQLPSSFTDMLNNNVPLMSTGTGGLDSLIQNVTAPGNYVDPFSAGSITGLPSLPSLNPTQLEQVTAITGLPTQNLAPQVPQIQPLPQSNPADFTQSIQNPTLDSTLSQGNTTGQLGSGTSGVVTNPDTPGSIFDPNGYIDPLTSGSILNTPGMTPITAAGLGTVAGATGLNTAGLGTASGATTTGNVFATPGQNLDSVMAGTGTGTTAPPSAWDQFMDKLKSASASDPLKALQLAQSAGGLLGLGLGTGAASGGSDTPYVPGPVNQAIVDQYRLPTGTQQGSGLRYQQFENYAMPQGLLDQRMNYMRGLL